MEYFKPIDAFFKDRNWIVNLLWLALYTLTVIGGLAVTGYVIRIVKRVREGVEELPDAFGSFDNFCDLWMDGLRFFISTLIYTVPIFAVGCFSGALFTAWAVKSSSGSADDALGVGVLAGIMIALGVMFLLSLLLSTISPALFIMASEDEGWGFAFNFPRLKDLICADIATYALLCLAVFGYLFIFGMCGNFIPFVGSLLFTPLAQICMGHLCGQYARTMAG
ncbi:DUF4013 domain-containing protein [bacterium]|nr:DUF4013 domain-containing protein [bacterium]